MSNQINNTQLAAQIAQIEERVDWLVKELSAQDKKLDQLLELKNKGLGAVWLVALIFSSGIIASLAGAFNWLRG